MAFLDLTFSPFKIFTFFYSVKHERQCCPYSSNAKTLTRNADCRKQISVLLWHCALLQKCASTSSFRPGAKWPEGRLRCLCECLTEVCLQEGHSKRMDLPKHEVSTRGQRCYSQIQSPIFVKGVVCHKNSDCAFTACHTMSAMTSGI